MAYTEEAKTLFAANIEKYVDKRIALGLIRVEVGSGGCSEKSELHIN